MKKYGTEGIFRKSLMAGNIEEKVEGILNGVFLSLHEGVIQKPRKLITKEYLTKRQEKSMGRLSQIEVKVSSKWKTCLKDIWKVFYQDNQQKSGYFLVNDYQRNLGDLVIGETRNILLVSG